MPFSLPMSQWEIITHLGSASILLPVLVLSLIGLWQAQQKRAAILWLGTFGLAVLATLISKILFMAWGIGIAPIQFTGGSGHTLFATSVLPILFGWLFAGQQRRFGRMGIALGILISIAVGISRVVLDAHSLSEVIAGWLAGVAVCAVTLHALKARTSPPAYVWLSPLFLLFALSTTLSTYLPTHDWEMKIALRLSGQERLFMR